MDLLRELMTRDPTPRSCATLIEWWRPLASELGAVAPLSCAVLGGFAADRLGYAFVAGYSGALRALSARPAGDAPSDAPDELTCLCATEEGGNHPRAIRARLVPHPAGGYVLDGEKRWATLAPMAHWALVVASIGEQGGKNQLRVARIPLSRAGVEVVPLEQMPFVPEVPHAVVKLRGVQVAERELLPGDGYERYLKPFRTVEDLHVHAALLGYLIGLGRRAAFPREIIERLLVNVAGAAELARHEVLAPVLHLALAGLLAEAASVVLDIGPHWVGVGADERERWERDRSLLAVASTAREARREAAWRRLTTGGDD